MAGSRPNTRQQSGYRDESVANDGDDTSDETNDESACRGNVKVTRGTHSHASSEGSVLDVNHVQLAALLLVEEGGESEGDNGAGDERIVGVEHGPVLLLVVGQATVEAWPVQPEEDRTCKYTCTETALTSTSVLKVQYELHQIVRMHTEYCVSQNSSVTICHSNKLIDVLATYYVLYCDWLEFAVCTCARTNHGEEVRLVDGALLGRGAMNVIAEQDTSDSQAEVGAERVHEH